MTSYIKIFFAGMLLVFAAACNKIDSLPYYAAGSAPVLTSSAMAITPTVADSSNTVITFSWTDPGYAGIDSSNEKYFVELDSAGRNFMKAIQYTITGSRSFSLTGNELNNALVAWGLAFNTAHDIDVRVTSSHTNNNEQFYSNVVTVKMTPYALPFDLVAADPGPFTITIQNKDNSIESFSWHSPAYSNATFTYELQYDTAGASFANAKTIAASMTDSTATLKASDLNDYAMTAGIAAGMQGSLDFRVIATVNGKQQVASSTQTIQVTPNILLAVLHVAGDYQGWSPDTAPLIASTDAVAYEGYVNITTTGGFKFTSQPDWNGTNYGDGGANKLSTDGSAGNLNVPQAGYYLLKANTSDLTWSATSTNWGIIGAATPHGWDASTPLTYDAVTNTWVIESIALTADAFKFRANDNWDINLGGNPAKLSYGGDNLSVPEAGTYKVVLDLSNPLTYTYKLIKL